MGSKAAELFLTYFLLSWHTYLLNAGKNYLLCQKKWKGGFLTCWSVLKNAAFAQMKGKKKKKNLVPTQARAQLCDGCRRRKSCKSWSRLGGDNGAGLVLLDKHPLGCSFKEANLDFDFNKPVARGFLYLHVCSYRDCAISGVSHISQSPLCASNSIVSPASLELEAESASCAEPALICLEALFSLL